MVELQKSFKRSILVRKRSSSWRRSYGRTGKKRSACRSSRLEMNPATIISDGNIKTLVCKLFDYLCLGQRLCGLRHRRCQRIRSLHVYLYLKCPKINENGKCPKINENGKWYNYKRATTSAPQKGRMISLPLRDDDEENDADEAKMLLIGDNGINAESFSPLRDGAPELQQYNIRSIESTVVIRQLTSQGLSFQLWPAASTFVTLLDNYRRDPGNSPLTDSLSSLKSPPLNIIELGSGTGIVGIAAAITLSANVTVTDLPHVLDNLNFNANGNAEAVARFGGKVHVAPLQWGEADDVEVLGRNVDLILASDVVYHDHLYEPLLKTLRLMMTTLKLEGKRLIFLMAHLRRWKKESVFFKKARKLFDVEIIHSDVPQEGSRIGVMVYRFVTKQPNQNGQVVSC